MFDAFVWMIFLFTGISAPVRPQALQPLSGSSAQVPPTYRITGKMINSMTGEPVAGAYVTIGSAPDLSRTVRTRADGGFAFGPVAAGRYVLRARRRGFVEQLYLQHERFTSAILVGPDLNSENLVFPITPESVISGEVTDEVGDPVRDASVVLFRDDAAEGKHTRQVQARQTTDDEGHYRFVRLKSGSYYLAVSAKPWYAQHPYDEIESASVSELQTKQKTTQTPANLDVVYPITYYPNAKDAGGAGAIHLDEGGRASADVTLIPMPALRMKIETGETGPERSVQVLLTETTLGGDEVESGNYDFDGENGFVELVGLRPGSVRVQVRTGNSGNRTSQWISRVVSVDPADGRTLDARTISSAVEVSGIVTMEGDRSPLNGVNIGLRNLATARTKTVRAGADGAFKFVNADFDPGTYQVSASGPGQMELQSVVATGAQAVGRKIEIGEGNDVRLVLRMARGVNGRVKGIAERDGKPIAGVMVVLVPENLKELSEYRRDQSDSDGSFSLNAAAPGKYTVVATDDWDLEWARPEVIQRYLKGGEAVRIESGQESKVRVKVAVAK